ncbi:hypothetical protein FTX61_04885 [Nitriliruptoraceae bacterium ZYF776]|nr:hypothetical protein [Profundirhabdus halotolerans]
MEPDPQVHAPRRTPEEPDRAVDLRAEAAALLAEAADLRAQRSARNLTPGAGAALSQSLLALKAGQQLQDHVAPGPTTLLALQGEALLHHGDEPVRLAEGHWAVCPTDPHSVEAVTDTVLLITVVPTGSTPDDTAASDTPR